jgi:hypothetical protein
MCCGGLVWWCCLPPGANESIVVFPLRRHALLSDSSLFMIVHGIILLSADLDEWRIHGC